MTNFISNSFLETVEIGRKIGKTLQAGDIICLEGDLGAGKTSLTKGIAQSLNIEEEITSPTYTIISEYPGKYKLFHMDLYRIDSSEEFEMIGADEILFSDGISIIEWSERIEDYLPDEKKIINITIQENGSRKIILTGMDI